MELELQLNTSFTEMQGALFICNKIYFLLNSIGTLQGYR